MQVHQQRAQLKLLVRRARQFAPAVASEVATLAWSNPDAALTTFVRAFEREHFELDETVCEQGFDFWVDAASEFIPMLMRSAAAWFARPTWACTCFPVGRSAMSATRSSCITPITPVSS
jgi:hypothetical protein